MDAPQSSTFPGLKAALEPLHRSRSTVPIIGADTSGLFPDAQLLFGGPEPLVPDANWLRDDVLHSARSHRHSAMLSLANAGVIRLYCGSHLLAEVQKHHPRWVKNTNVSDDEFWRCWTERYLPHLRVVDAPTDLLTVDELVRVEVLRDQDPDDVPSVVLALVLSAPYLSTDQRAVAAVYGDDNLRRERSDLLRFILAMGDYSGADEMLRSTAMLPVLIVQGLWHLGRAAWMASPPLTTLGALGVMWATSFLTPSARQRLGTALLQAAEILQPLSEEFAGLRRVASSFDPPAPTARALTDEVAPRHVLARGAMRTMARAKESHLSAVELADVLDDLGVAQSASALRQLLRRLPTCFEEVARGRWQLGCARRYPTLAR